MPTPENIPGPMPDDVLRAVQTAQEALRLTAARVPVSFHAPYALPASPPAEDEEPKELTYGDINEAQAEILETIVSLATVDEPDAKEALSFARAAEIWSRIIAELGLTQVVEV